MRARRVLDDGQQHPSHVGQDHPALRQRGAPLHFDRISAVDPLAAILVRQANNETLERPVSSLMRSACPRASRTVACQPAGTCSVWMIAAGPIGAPSSERRANPGPNPRQLSRPRPVHRSSCFLLRALRQHQHHVSDTRKRQGRGPHHGRRSVARSDARSASGAADPRPSTSRRSPNFVWPSATARSGARRLRHARRHRGRPHSRCDPGHPARDRGWNCLSRRAQPRHHRRLDQPRGFRRRLGDDLRSTRRRRSAIARLA